MQAPFQPDRRRSLKGWHIAAALAVPAVLLIAAIVAVFLAGPPVQGGLRLGTAVGEPDLELYVGDRLVGLNEAFVTWDDILGWDGQEPLGIVLRENALPVPKDQSEIESLSGADAVSLAGPGAAVVSVEAGNPMWSRYQDRHEFAKKEILLRRADGSLDQVFCLDGRLTDLHGNTRRVLVPIRVRPRNGSSATYSKSEARRTGGGRFSNFLHRVTPEWNFESTEPPEDLAAELEKEGLWTPPE